ncbi:MAG TPA: UPF0149 family protein [Spongiibacteraceae bacterium]
MSAFTDRRAAISIAMENSNSLDFLQLGDLLQNFGALLGPAELHGFLVGQLATGKRFSRGEWLRTANEQADLSQSPDEVAGDRLYDLYRHTLTSLQSGELEFQLLLPEDDDSLCERVENLGQWCQGFLTGFGLAGGALKIDEELAEALRDLSAIAQVGANDEDAALDSSESDFFSICEYVRLMAVEIFWNHNSDATAVKRSAPDNKSSAASPADLFKRNKLH